MIVLWLLAMGLFVAWLAVPVVRRVGFSYGRFGQVSDMLLVLGGAILGGVVLAALLQSIGQSMGDAGMLALGFVGAMVVVILLTLFSASSAAAEPSELRETPPGHPIDDTHTVRTTTRPEGDPSKREQI